MFTNVITVSVYDLNSVRFIRSELSTQDMIFILHHTAFVIVINIFSSNHNLPNGGGGGYFNPNLTFSIGNVNENIYFHVYKF